VAIIVANTERDGVTLSKRERVRGQ